MLSLHRFIISSLRTNNTCVCVCVYVCVCARARMHVYSALTQRGSVQGISFDCFISNNNSLYLLHIYQKLNTCKVIF